MTTCQPDITRQDQSIILRSNIPKRSSEVRLTHSYTHYGAAAFSPMIPHSSHPMLVSCSPRAYGYTNSRLLVRSLHHTLNILLLLHLGLENVYTGMRLSRAVVVLSLPCCVCLYGRRSRIPASPRQVKSRRLRTSMVAFSTNCAPTQHSRNAAFQRALHTICTTL